MLAFALAPVAQAQPGTPATTGQVNLTSGVCTTEGVTSAGCVALGVSTYAGLSIQVTGTWTGTLAFRGSTDGTTFAALNCAASNSTSAVTSTSANGLWKCGVAALRYAEVIFTSFSSGTAVVTMQAGIAADGSGTSAAGSGSNAAAGATGSAVPASASYTGINSGGTLVGLPGDTTNGAFVNCKAGCAAAGDSTAAAQNITSGAGNGSTFPNGPAPSGLVLAGDRGAAFQLAAGGTLIATITPQCSADGGTTYFNGYFQDFFTGATSTTQVIASGQAVTVWQVLCPAGSSHAQLKATAFTSGAASFTGRATVASWPPVDMGVVTTAAPSYTNGQIAPVSLTPAGAERVDGSAVTQPISAASLPLPAGAATAAKQPALGTAGTSSADVITVQGRAAMTPILVDGSATTQPVTGTVTANAGANLNTSALLLDATYTGRMPAGASPATGESNTNTALSRIGVYNFTFNGTTWDRWTGGVTANAGTNLNTSALFLDATYTGRMPAGASPANGESNTNTALSRIGGFNFIYNGSTWDRWTGSVTATQATGTNLHMVCDSGCSSSAGFADNSAFTYGTTAINPIGGVLDDVSTNQATENSAAIARITPFKALHINFRNQAGTEIGTSGAPIRTDPTGTTTQPVNTAQVAGTTTSVNAGVSDAGTQRMALSYDGVVTLQASQTSGVTNATTTRTTTTGLGPYTDLVVLINITNAGAATGTLQLYLEDSIDGGTTWDDLVSSSTFTFGASTTNMQYVVSGKLSTSRPQGQASQAETLTANSVRQGPFADRIRVREKVSGVAGSPTGVTYTITAVAKR